MQQSSHYGFNKPDYADQYDLRHWNENTDSLDDILNNNGLSPNNDNNALGNRINAEKTARENADSTLQENITSEATNRANADNALGTSIDGIVNGNTTVNKARADEDGNRIKATYQKTSNRVNSWQSTPDNTHYPSEKLVKDSLDEKANSSHTHNVVDINNLPITKISYYYKNEDDLQVRLPSLQVGELIFIHVNSSSHSKVAYLMFPNDLAIYYLFKDLNSHAPLYVYSSSTGEEQLIDGSITTIKAPTVTKCIDTSKTIRGANVNTHAILYRIS